MLAAVSPLIVFALTLFTSAFLLFLVQPMVGKQILPKLGGAPAVWSTCMLFYQAVLLGGYTYAHFITKKLPPRKQVMFHFVLLGLVLVAFAVFPVGRAYKYLNPTGDLTNVTEVVLWVLLILTPIIGLPFFVVSATAPLFQRWFAYTGHEAARDPYFLYAASNLGSMISLLAYPVFVETYLGLPPQGMMWMAGYLVLLVLAIWCGWLVLKQVPAEPAVKVVEAGRAASADNGASALADVEEGEEEAEESALTDKPGQVVVKSKKMRAKDRAKAASLDAIGREPGDPNDPPVAVSEPEPLPTPAPRSDAGPGLMQYLRWILLGFVPSSLMLGVTMYMTTDVSPVPFLWLIPLALYLLSFIIVFSQSFDYAFRGVLGLPFWFLNKDPKDHIGPEVNIHALMTLLLPVVVLLMVFQVVSGHDLPSLWMRFAVHLGAMFIVAMVCHGELARTRPQTEYLTSFYLAMSFGGVLGGLFNALIAPVVFNTVAEYSLVLVLACLLLPSMWEENRSPFNRYVDIFLAVALGGAGLYVVMLYVARYLGWEWGSNNYQYLPTFSALPGMQIQLVGYLMIAAGGAAFVWYVARARQSERLERILDVALPGALCLLSMLIIAMRPFSHWTAAWVPDGENQYYSHLFAAVAKVLGTINITIGDPMLRSIFTFGIPVALCYGFAERPIRLGLGVGAILLASALQLPIDDYGRYRDKTVYKERSFFGVLKVEHQEFLVGDGDRYYYQTQYHKLLHGTTLHGMQQAYWYPDAESYGLVALPAASALPMQAAAGWWLVAKALEDPRQEPLTYYHRTGPIGQVYEELISGPDATAPVAFIGLGTGTMAAYCNPGQKVTFYEIDHAVVRIAEDPQHFTYLQNCKQRGGDYEFKMGDARLMMEKAPDKHYKLIVVDAFSSDAIPVHLTTKEAVELYLSKLRDDGVVAMHISNRHLELEPVLANIGEALGVSVIQQYDHDDQDHPGKNASDWVMIAKKPEAFGKLREAMWRWPADRYRRWPADLEDGWPDDPRGRWKDLLHKGDAQKTMTPQAIADWKELWQAAEEAAVRRGVQLDTDEMNKEVDKRLKDLKRKPSDEEYERIYVEAHQELVKKKAEVELTRVKEKWAKVSDDEVRARVQQLWDELWEEDMAFRQRVGVWTDDFSNILSIWR